jgi:hypothetical protein
MRRSYPSFYRFHIENHLRGFDNISYVRSTLKFGWIMRIPISGKTIDEFHFSYDLVDMKVHDNKINSEIMSSNTPNLHRDTFSAMTAC